MTKTIKESYINYLIMKEFGEEINVIKKGLIEHLQQNKERIEKRLINSVMKEDNESFNTFKNQLSELDELITKAKFDILGFDFEDFYTMTDETYNKVNELFQIMNINK